MVEMSFRSEREEKLLEQILAILRTITVRTNRTKMVEVDLSIPHTDEPLGLEAPGRIYRWLTIERCDNPLNYRLKQTDGTLSDIFRAYEAARFSHHDFLDIIVSNPPTTGVCRFIVGFWEG